MRKREVIEPRKKINEQMQMLSPKQHAISVISIRRDIMRNLSGVFRTWRVQHSYAIHTWEDLYAPNYKRFNISIVKAEEAKV